MHSSVYLTICAASVGGMLLFGTPDLFSMVLVAALAIAVLGVPHGGLDHWFGRRLLRPRFAGSWWAVFFPVYLSIGIVFAIGWFVAPTITVLLFFLISAWHFGREDQHASAKAEHRRPMRFALDHLTAAGVGGLVIWVPALTRPEEMLTLLSLIVPGNNVESPAFILQLTQWISLFLIPLATLVVGSRLVRSPRDCDCWVPVASAMIAVAVPILISFTIYFCAWHSWQGLQRLRREESMSVVQFVRCIALLSVAAIVGVAAAGWWVQGFAVQSTLGGQSAASLQTVFIGLSALAVPHLLLHELGSLRHTTLRVVKSKQGDHNSESCVTVISHSQPQVFS